MRPWHSASVQSFTLCATAVCGGCTRRGTNAVPKLITFRGVSSRASLRNQRRMRLSPAAPSGAHPTKSRAPRFSGQRREKRACRMRLLLRVTPAWPRRPTHSSFILMARRVGTDAMARWRATASTGRTRVTTTSTYQSSSRVMYRQITVQSCRQ